MKKEFFLYVDEAGNSGINYLDSAQPFYITAAWLCEKHHVEKIFNTVDEFNKKYSMKEIKGKNLMRNESQQFKSLDLHRGLLKSGALPFYTISHKSHSLALKFVEIFLDPFSNPSVSWLPTSYFNKRRDIATLLYRIVPQTAWMNFLKSYKKDGKIEGWIKIVNDSLLAIQKKSRSIKDKNLRINLIKSLISAKKNIDEIYEQEIYTDLFGFSHSQWVSLNLPVFAHLLRYVEEYFLHRNDDCHINIIHDETSTFSEILEYYVNIFKKIDDMYIPIDDNRPFLIGLEKVNSFKVCKSHEELPIQAADFLASSINKLCVSFHKKEKWNSSLEEIASDILIHLYHGEDKLRLGGMMGPQDFIDDLTFRSIGEKFKSTLITSHIMGMNQ